MYVNNPLRLLDLLGNCPISIPFSFHNGFPIGLWLYYCFSLSLPIIPIQCIFSPHYFTLIHILIWDCLEQFGNIHPIIYGSGYIPCCFYHPDKLCILCQHWVYFLYQLIHLSFIAYPFTKRFGKYMWGFCNL